MFWSVLIVTSESLKKWLHRTIPVVFITNLANQLSFLWTHVLNSRFELARMSHVEFNFVLNCIESVWRNNVWMMTLMISYSRRQTSCIRFRKSRKAWINIPCVMKPPCNCSRGNFILIILLLVVRESYAYINFYSTTIIKAGEWQDEANLRASYLPHNLNTEQIPSHEWQTEKNLEA